jgi:hypothetical protein
VGLIDATVLEEVPDPLTEDDDSDVAVGDDFTEVSELLTVQIALELPVPGLQVFVAWGLQVAGRFWLACDDSAAIKLMNFCQLASN